MKTPNLTPGEFREYLDDMSRSEFRSARESDIVNECLNAGSPYTEIWEEAVSLRHSLDALDVPEPKVNIAASVMASIANERVNDLSNQHNSFSKRVIEIVSWQFQIPAWGVAAILFLLIGSISLNMIGSESSALPNSENPLVATKDDQPDTTDQPTFIVVPQGPESFVPVSGNSGLPLTANPSPSLVIIMGTPPSAWLSENYNYESTSYTSFKEEEI